jgi:hypothetical protein
VSPAVAFQARLTPYLQNGSTAVQALRPGATPFSVQVGLTDPKVGSVTPAQLLFNPGDSQHPFSFQPLAAGSTLLSLSVPGGFTDPLALRQQLLTVIGPRVTLGGALSVGKDLQSTAIVNIPSPAAAALSVTITSDDPSRLLLSDSVHPNGAASLNITILPGATTGSGFSLIGLASSGTVSLSLTAPPLTSSSYDISLQPSGFVFGSTIGSPAANTAFSVPIVVSALNPVSLTPTGTYSLRPGLQPVAVTVASSDSSIIDPGNATTFFSENTSQGSLRVQAKSPGNATLTIQAPPGFAMPSGGATANITVR